MLFYVHTGLYINIHLRISDFLNMAKNNDFEQMLQQECKRFNPIATKLIKYRVIQVLAHYDYWYQIMRQTSCAIVIPPHNSVLDVIHIDHREPIYNIDLLRLGIGSSATKKKSSSSMLNKFTSSKAGS